ncbi:hypothetical protein ACFLRM_03965 [Acidobacteriota bacterium]
MMRISPCKFIRPPDSVVAQFSDVDTIRYDDEAEIYPGAELYQDSPEMLTRKRRRSMAF